MLSVAKFPTCSNHSFPRAPERVPRSPFGHRLPLLVLQQRRHTGENPFWEKVHVRHAALPWCGHGGANLNIAKSKAELESRKVIAQQVRTNLKVVSDAYASELVGTQASETVEKFESLAREVTNNTIGDIRQLGQDIRQLEDQTYRVHVAVEIKKKAMFRFLKDKAATTPRSLSSHAPR